MGTDPELGSGRGRRHVLGDQVVRLVGLRHAPDRLEVLAWEASSEVPEDVGTHLSADVRADGHRPAHFQEGRQDASVQRVEQRCLVVPRKKGRVSGSRVRKELLHHLGRLCALVDVVAEEHHVRLAARSEDLTKSTEGVQASVDVAHERDLGTHSRIFSTSA